MITVFKILQWMNEFKIITTVIFVVITLCSCRGDLLYKEGKYSIRKKNIVSYYQASPDLFVDTDSGQVKINLNRFGKRLIPQEKITTIKIAQVSGDSIRIHFSSGDTRLKIKDEFISVNVKRAVDSISAIKK